MRETQVWFLGWEDLQVEGMATQSSILAWRIPWTEEPVCSPWGYKESDMTEWLTHNGNPRYVPKIIKHVYSFDPLTKKVKYSIPTNLNEQLQITRINYIKLG